jgi:hypothetical protein
MVLMEKIVPPRIILIPGKDQYFFCRLKIARCKRYKGHHYVIIFCQGKQRFNAVKRNYLYSLKKIFTATTYRIFLLAWSDEFY